MTNPLKISLKKGAFEKQDKVFSINRKNGLGNKSETDFSMRRNKDKKQKGNIKKSEYLRSSSQKELDFKKQIS